MKNLSSVGLAIAVATASMLAGCQLYFGSNSNGNGNGGEGNPPGFKCNGDAQCAAGCFCSKGICAEGGFCAGDKDCGASFHCDMARSSCIPNPACTASEQCAAGSMCDNGGCVTTCKCTSDAEAVKQGAGWCDETRGTCMPGKDPAGACTGDVTCTTVAPKCPEGQVALVNDGCFTGACRAITACEADPVCKALQYENDCKVRTDCSTLTIGRDCHHSDGSDCHTGDTDCVCASIAFLSCESKATTPAPVLVVE